VRTNGIEFIQKSNKSKKAGAEKDHKEAGLRKTLNFGHTIGHAIEGYLLSNEIPTLHGYGVAWGILAESYISFKQNLLSEAEYTEIKTHITKTYPAFTLDEDCFEDLLKLMGNDKKNRSGKLQMVLLKGIGNAVYDQAVSDEEILSALRELKG